ncbi:hypothetical protein K402DRAFT_416565 [Aulographum hederae CBS 113979]|uniref:Uncharacterized protein n=1 Tax=Aulographum hederae CBS 113979 TaxID=1176131 RepID=A0A6G1HFZ9_9PEZI|nr:hypothetical protein K402DRAFT_416565 [Aulographum hederae CBS 113979]
MSNQPPTFQPPIGANPQAQHPLNINAPPTFITRMPTPQSVPPYNPNQANEQLQHTHLQSVQLGPRPHTPTIFPVPGIPVQNYVVVFRLAVNKHVICNSTTLAWNSKFFNRTLPQSIMHPGQGAAPQLMLELRFNKQNWSYYLYDSPVDPQIAASTSMLASDASHSPTQRTATFKICRNIAAAHELMLHVFTTQSISLDPVYFKNPFRPVDADFAFAVFNAARCYECVPIVCTAVDAALLRNLTATLDMCVRCPVQMLAIAAALGNQMIWREAALGLVCCAEDDWNEAMAKLKAAGPNGWLVPVVEMQNLFATERMKVTGKLKYVEERLKGIAKAFGGEKSAWPNETARERYMTIYLGFLRSYIPEDWGESPMKKGYAEMFRKIEEGALTEMLSPSNSLSLPAAVWRIIKEAKEAVKSVVRDRSYLKFVSQHQRGVLSFAELSPAVGPPWIKVAEGVQNRTAAPNETGKVDGNAIARTNTPRTASGGAKNQAIMTQWFMESRKVTEKGKGDMTTKARERKDKAAPASAERRRPAAPERELLPKPAVEQGEREPVLIGPISSPKPAIEPTKGEARSPGFTSLLVPARGQPKQQKPTASQQHLEVPSSPRAPTVEPLSADESAAAQANKNLKRKESGDMERRIGKKRSTGDWQRGFANEKKIDEEI